MGWGGLQRSERSDADPRIGIQLWLSAGRVALGDSMAWVGVVGELGRYRCVNANGGHYPEC